MGETTGSQQRRPWNEEGGQSEVERERKKRKNKGNEKREERSGESGWAGRSAKRCR